MICLDMCVLLHAGCQDVPANQLQRERTNKRLLRVKFSLTLDFHVQTSHFNPPHFFPPLK